jgi:hypothetical protein
MLLVIGLAVIALFAILAVVTDPGDGYQANHDPRNDLPIWALIGRR